MRLLWLGYWAFVLVYAGLVAWLLPHRQWDPDEFEHLQASWLIGEGLTPYRDFFEHHTPLWHLLTSAVFHVVEPDSFERATALMVGSRAFSFLCSAAVAALTWSLARRFAGRTVAAFALLLLLASSPFMQKGVEIRPDPLSTLCILVAVYALARAFARPVQETGSAGSALRPAGSVAAWVALAGGMGTLAVLASQKALFAGPGLALAFVWLAGRRFGPRRPWVLAAWGVAGAAVAAAPILAFFASRGALGAFVHHNFLLNAAWTRDKPDDYIWQVLTLRYDAVVVALALVGVALLIQKLRRPDRYEVWALIAAPLLSLIAGLAILPVPQKQYIFMMMPFAAICGAVAVCHAPIGWGTRPRSLGGAVLAGVIVLSMARNLEWSFYRTDEDTRAKFAFLLRNVPPDETVMGSWSPGVAFRHPAWTYFFLHGEVQSMIPPAEYRTLAEKLQTGAIRPALVDFDRFMSQMPPDVLAEIQRLYEPTEVASLWKRRNPPPRSTVFTDLATGGFAATP